jgi:hypothetical protein
MRTHQRHDVHWSSQRQPQLSGACAPAAGGIATGSRCGSVVAGLGPAAAVLLACDHAGAIFVVGVTGAAAAAFVARVESDVKTGDIGGDNESRHGLRAAPVERGDRRATSWVTLLHDAVMPVPLHLVGNENWACSAWGDGKVRVCRASDGVHVATLWCNALLQRTITALCLAGPHALVVSSEQSSFVACWRLQWLFGMHQADTTVTPSPPPRQQLLLQQQRQQQPLRQPQKPTELRPSSAAHARAVDRLRRCVERWDALPDRAPFTYALLLTTRCSSLVFDFARRPDAELAWPQRLAGDDGGVPLYSLHVAGDMDLRVVNLPWFLTPLRLPQGHVVAIDASSTVYAAPATVTAQHVVMPPGDRPAHTAPGPHPGPGLRAAVIPGPGDATGHGSSCSTRTQDLQRRRHLHWYISERPAGVCSMLVCTNGLVVGTCPAPAMPPSLMNPALGVSYVAVRLSLCTTSGHEHQLFGVHLTARLRRRLHDARFFIYAVREDAAATVFAASNEHGSVSVPLSGMGGPGSAGPGSSMGRSRSLRGHKSRRGTAVAADAAQQLSQDGAAAQGDGRTSPASPAAAGLGTLQLELQLWRASTGNIELASVTVGACEWGSSGYYSDEASLDASLANTIVSVAVIHTTRLRTSSVTVLIGTLSGHVCRYASVTGASGDDWEATFRAHPHKTRAIVAAAAHGMCA